MTRTPLQSRSAETAWTAVLDRNAAADGQFVYGVRTTGVYCRPSCPARRPKRANVEFFDDGAAASRAGYRACRRCRPDSESAGPDPVEAAYRLLTDEGAERLTLPALARRVGLSPFHLQRRFKERYGLTPRELANTGRASRFRAALRGGSTVSRATYDAGYGSGSRVYESATSHLGMTPARYARGGRGLVIRYTTVDSPFGRVLVGVTDRGVSCVSLGRSDRTLRADLGTEFPEARLVRVDAGADPWLSSLVHRVAETLMNPRAGAIQVPLDLLGTAFQYRVWQALLEIPAGSTRSYSEVARAIGRPTATRAVARAIASNRVAVLVPCHRVVREDGTLGGYRWGMPAKRSLLALEGSAPPAAR